MTDLLSSLASLRIAVVLLVLLLVGLAAGTIIDSSRGAEVAGSLVYYSWWFIALEAAFMLNVVAAIALFFPWGRQRIGFVTTHSALVLILAGAVVSFFYKTEGRLGLWEGDTGNEIVSADERGAVTSRTTLPFAVRLLDFRIDHYPGTMQPAGFRSDIEVIDADGSRFQAGVWMNHQLTYKGWSLFQSSYRQEGGREATVLSVSKDPGQPIVFAGYVLLVVGMCIVLATRVSQARLRAELQAAAAAARRHRKAIAMALVASVAAAGSAFAVDDVTELIRRLPVQHDGRVMPFDTVAREGVWHVTGKRAWHGADPVATAVSWMADPSAAANAPVIALGSADVARTAGLSPDTRYASFSQLVNSRAIRQLVGDARQAEARGQPRGGVLAEAAKLEERLESLQRFMNRDVIRTVPNASDPSAMWTVPEVRSMAELAALATGPRPQGWPTAAAVEREITYNAVRPTRVAWIVLLVAVVLSLAAGRTENRVIDGVAFTALLASVAVMTWGIATRWAVAGRFPAANMYESLLFLAWGVGFFAVIAFALLRNRLVVLNASIMAAVTMALTDLLPIDGFIHPVPPVLSGTPWLAIHVPIIMVSYSVLALGVVIAHMQIGFTIFASEREETIARMADLLYWYTMVGSILLITGIFTGSIWAASSWGRYWGWDPKEVWSLVAFLAYMAIVHARWDGLIGAFGVAAISIVAFQTILMTYLGVNFVLGTGLHSYGFGESPVARWMVIVAVVEGAFLGWGYAAHRKHEAAAA